MGHVLHLYKECGVVYAGLIGVAPVPALPAPVGRRPGHAPQLAQARHRLGGHSMYIGSLRDDTSAMLGHLCAESGSARERAMLPWKSRSLLLLEEVRGRFVWYRLPDGTAVQRSFGLRGLCVQANAQGWHARSHCAG